MTEKFLSQISSLMRNECWQCIVFALLAFLIQMFKDTKLHDSNSADAEPGLPRYALRQNLKSRNSARVT
jgi:hypothetical protein